jgi:hypothetical protein
MIEISEKLDGNAPEAAIRIVKRPVLCDLVITTSSLVSDGIYYNTSQQHAPISRDIPHGNFQTGFMLE